MLILLNKTDLYKMVQNEQKNAKYEIRTREAITQQSLSLSPLTTWVTWLRSFSVCKYFIIIDIFKVP